MQLTGRRSQIRRRRGTTLVEMLGVILLVGLLLGLIGTSITKSMKRSNRESVVNELQIFSTSIADAYYDLGAPSYPAGDPDAESEFTRWLTRVQDEYMSVQFNWDTLEVTDSGYTIEIDSPYDVFESPYRMWFVTSADLMKYAMVASGGEDGKIDATGYAVQDYADDIVLIVRPKS